MKEMVKKILEGKNVIEEFENLIGGHRTIINEDEAKAYVKAKNLLLFGKIEEAEDSIDVLKNVIADCK